MVGIIMHRGPDASGILLDGPMAMGMRRLSILDLDGGHQPLYNEDRSVAVVYNGEIYNYVELRSWLASRGHQLRSDGDTEVLVHLYEELGTDFLPWLNGMFAFALWDRAKQRLLLARDRMGVKPLYFTTSRSGLGFASELKSLIAAGLVDGAVDPDAIADYLRLGYVPRERSALAGVRRLLPGHYLVATTDGERDGTWWDLARDISYQSLEETSSASDELTGLFDDAVRLRMRSDVPVASFLSGGFDSSAVSATANSLSPIRLRTFTVGFSGARFDETPLARSVAECCSTEHNEVFADPREAMAELPRLLWHLDEPIADSAILASYLVSRFAAQQVKVCLSGLGGDELFGGYGRYVDNARGRIRRAFASAPALAGAIAPLASRVRSAWADELQLAADPSAAWHSYLQRLQIFDTPELQKLGLGAQGQVPALIEDLWARYPGRDPVGRRQFIDQHTYLPDQILALTDRMSMAASLEVRVPFMDYRLVGFATRLPHDLKQTGTEYKILLKRALSHRLPPEIATRPKWGFDAPVARWLSEPPLLDPVQRLPRLLSGFVDARYVTRLVESPERIRHQSRRIWSLLTLAVWERVRRHTSAPTSSLSEVLA
jgi:asparagine synthase (glutamine-hydrolysing)